MTQNKIQASTVILVTLLLAGGLFVAANINKNSAMVDDPSIIPSGDEAAASALPTVLINELMADNDAAVQSPAGTHPDWIELFNYGDDFVDLSDMYLTDSLANRTWQLPKGTILVSKSHIVIWTDGKPRLGAFHANFKLRANGGTVGLFASDGETLIDYVVYDKQLRDISYGRIPDGGSYWDYMTIPTAGSANIENERATSSTPWPIWLLIALALAACVIIVLKDRFRARRKD